MTLDEIIDQAILEDVGEGDHTTLATITEDARGSAFLLVKEPGILCGMETAEKVFSRIDKDLSFISFIPDGSKIMPGDVPFRIAGSARSILTGERLALNFMQRMSGIATFTARIAAQLEGLKTVILDTRKTTPLMREMERIAVRTGGGRNHRMGLYDMILIKNNHIDFCGGIREAISRTLDYLERNRKDLKIEIEVRNQEELDLVLKHGRVDRIMLDNFSPAELKIAVERIGGQFETEASGGISERNIREFAVSGVDFISVGALTHQIRSLDMSLRAVMEKDD